MTKFWEVQIMNGNVQARIQELALGGASMLSEAWPERAARGDPRGVLSRNFFW